VPYGDRGHPSIVRRLRVLVMTPWFPTAQNRVSGVFVLEQVQALLAHHDVVVLHLRGIDRDPSTKDWWRVERARGEDAISGVRTYHVWYRPPVSRLGSLFSVGAAFSAVRQVARDFPPDLIHAHVYSAGFPAVIVGRWRRGPVVVSEHFTGFLRGTLSRRDLRQARLAFSWADRTLPVSHALQLAIEAHGIRAKFEPLPNVVDTSVFYPRIEEKTSMSEVARLLFVGLLDAGHNKGVIDLLRALNDMGRSSVNWHLDLVGDGPGRPTYEALAAQLGIADHVTFHGIQPRHRVADLMRRADLFVHPSHIETFGVVVAESLASGTPVVATRSGGPEEIVGDDDGRLVAAGDHRELAKAISSELARTADPQRRTRISQRAADRFSPENVMERLNGIYAEVLRESTMR